MYALCECQVAVRVGSLRNKSRAGQRRGGHAGVCERLGGVRGGGSAPLGGQLARGRPVGRRVAVSRQRSGYSLGGWMRFGGAAQPVRAGAPPGSGTGGHRAGLRQGGFADEAGDIAGEEQDVAQTGSLGAVGQAVPRRAFEMAACLAGIAAFGVALAALAQAIGR